MSRFDVISLWFYQGGQINNNNNYYNGRRQGGVRKDEIQQ